MIYNIYFWPFFLYDRKLLIDVNLDNTTSVRQKHSVQTVNSVLKRLAHTGGQGGDFQHLHNQVFASLT